VYNLIDDPHPVLTRNPVGGAGFRFPPHPVLTAWLYIANSWFTTYGLLHPSYQKNT